MQRKKTKSKGKSSNRKNAKNAALDPKYNPKIRSDNLDFDYLAKLGPKELKFLNDFMEEYNGAHLPKGKEKFHKSKKMRKLCTDINNARNRCIFSISKATGRLIYENNFEPWLDRETVAANSNIEDELIEYLDSSKKLKDTSDETE